MLVYLGVCVESGSCGIFFQVWVILLSMFICCRCSLVGIPIIFWFGGWYEILNTVFSWILCLRVVSGRKRVIIFFCIFI